MVSPQRSIDCSDRIAAFPSGEASHSFSSSSDFGRRPLIPSKISCGVRARGISAPSFLLATTRRSGLRGVRFLGLFLFAVRLRLALVFFAFRFLAMLLLS